MLIAKKIFDILKFEALEYAGHMMVMGLSMKNLMNAYLLCDWSVYLHWVWMEHFGQGK